MVGQVLSGTRTVPVWHFITVTRVTRPCIRTQFVFLSTLHPIFTDSSFMVIFVRNNAYSSEASEQSGSSFYGPDLGVQQNLVPTIQIIALRMTYS